MISAILWVCGLWKVAVALQEVSVFVARRHVGLVSVVVHIYENDECAMK